MCMERYSAGCVWTTCIEAPLVSVGIQLTAGASTINVSLELPIVCAVVDMNGDGYIT